LNLRAAYLNLSASDDAERLQRRHHMTARRLALVVAGAFAVSILAVGTGQAVCDPLCAPKANNGVDKLKGLDRADDVAGGGADGRANARAKQGIVPTPAPVVLPPDADGDGVPDAQDLCLNEAGPAPSGCPPPPPGA
jgi:hypothetical protein